MDAALPHRRHELAIAARRSRGRAAVAGGRLLAAVIAVAVAASVSAAGAAPPPGEAGGEAGDRTGGAGELDDDASGAPHPGPRGARPAVIDFGEEEAFAAGEVMTARDLDAVEHDDLLPDRFRRGLDAAVATEAAPARRWRAGARAGATMTALDRGDAPRWGATAGGFVHYRLRGRLGLQPELAFATRGAGGEGGARVDTLVVPVLVVGALPAGRRFTLGLVAGPAVAVPLAATAGGRDVSPFDVGVVAGAALAIALGDGALILDARYEHGLIELVEAAGRSRATSLTVGWSF